MRIGTLCTTGIVVVLATTGVLGQEVGTTALVFDEPIAAVVNARHWDETQQQWMDAQDQEKPLFFDSVHRFLLLRFPGMAEAVHARLQEGHRPVSARLTMRWVDQEFMRVRGYAHRSWPLQDREPPAWHAQVWALRRPWVDDGEIGPTWNAYLNGLGYWRAGGARDAQADRLPVPVAEVELSAAQPEATVDLSGLLESPEFGGSAGERLRALEQQGVLLSKLELYNEEFGEYGAPMATARIWVSDPTLVVELAPAEGPTAEALPPATDARALAERLRAGGPDGAPTTTIPDDLPARIAAFRERHREMPAWMMGRVDEIAGLKTRWDEQMPLYHRFLSDELADRDAYLAAIDGLLSVDPGYFMGHSHVDPIITLLDCGELLPDVARYHLRMGVQTRWVRPFNPERLSHRVGYFGGMATLNHQCQFRSEALLAGEILGDDDLTAMARRNLSLLNRQMLFLGGVIQEHGDSFYQGISLATLKTAARYVRDPLTAMQAELGIERMLWELNSTYHPGLKRHVSSVARRYRIETLLLDQDIPRAVLHTLSREGALIDLGEEEVHGLPVLGFNSTPPQRVANLAPWGEEHEANAIDRKPLPFLSVGADFVRGLAREPVYYTTYMGQNYALGSCHVDLSEEWPNQAAWRRAPEAVTTIEDLGVMTIRGWMNGAVSNAYDHEPEDRVKSPPLTAQLQHENRMICVMRPSEQRHAAQFCPEGVQDFFCRASVFAYGPEAPERLFAGDREVTQFPATARMGERIALNEGVTYVGLVPIGASELPMKAQVRISYEHPRLDLDAFALEADEPLPNTDASWQALMDATCGWLVEVADASEYGSFAEFRAHLAQMTVETAWSEEARTLSIEWGSGEESMALDFRTALERERDSRPWPWSQVITRAEVNGESPWPVEGVLFDSPLGQLVTTGRAEKAGATLDALPGQPAMLKVEPISGNYIAINPFVEPVPLELNAPGGVTVRAEGDFGCGRIRVCPQENALWVSYHLPPSGGGLGLEKLQADAQEGQHAGPAEWEEPIARFMRPGFDVRQAREMSARSLLVAGMRAPLRVELNGERMSAGLETVEADGREWLRVPIAQ